jgi:hypothetical protein
MARIAIEVSPAQLQKAKTLIDAGVYESVQQFGEIAFANQLALEDGADPEDLAQAARDRRGAVDKPANARSKIPPLPPPEQPRPKKSYAKAGDNIMRARDEAVAYGESPLSFAVVVEALSLANVPAHGAATSETTAAPEERILALVNKPLGLKIVARALLVNAVDEWPMAEDVAQSVARHAAAIGAELADHDRAAERTRNLLHTGLPTPDSPESLNRFAQQYLGRIARSGQVTPGAIIQFALATLDDGRIALSTAGAEFARLANPILDGGPRPYERAPAERVLSADEQSFLVEHVMRFVPGEAHDARLVVEAVQAGHSRPESLLVAVNDSLPSAWSDVQARSYLSGLVTRLSELDVLNRVWTGRTVNYELTTNAPIVLHGTPAREVA